MSHDLSFFNSSALFVQDVTGIYREAQSDEVLQAAQTLLMILCILQEQGFASLDVKSPQVKNS